MKARFLTLVLLAAMGLGAHAQELEEPFEPYFTLEIGTGLAPIHTYLNASGLRTDRELASQGQKPLLSNTFSPAFSLSAAWHTALRWEFVLTGGFSWCHHQVVQYGTFGVDPRGNPRYDLENPISTFWKDSVPAYALFVQSRRFWNPTQKVKLYSAFGLGFVYGGSGLSMINMGGIDFLPSVTPIAVRFGTGHLKFFIENTYSLAATVFDVGLGWTF